MSLLHTHIWMIVQCHYYTQTHLDDCVIVVITHTHGWFCNVVITHTNLNDCAMSLLHTHAWMLVQCRYHIRTHISMRAYTNIWIFVHCRYYTHIHLDGCAMSLHTHLHTHTSGWLLNVVIVHTHTPGWLCNIVITHTHPPGCFCNDVI